MFVNNYVMPSSMTIYWVFTEFYWITKALEGLLPGFYRVLMVFKLFKRSGRFSRSPTGFLPGFAELYWVSKGLARASGFYRVFNWVFTEFYLEWCAAAGI